MTMFVLSPFVATTAASASGSARAFENGHVHPVADDEPAAPARAEPNERVLVLVDDRHVPAVRGKALGDGGADAAAPDDDGVHGAPAYSSKTPSGNATTSTSHWRVAQDEVDGRREEARLPAPARRRAENDQVGVASLGLVDDRVADRARADDVSVHLDAVVRAERARLVERRVDPRGDLRRQLALELELARNAHDGDRLDLGAALLRERDRRRDHLLADVTELHRHEDPLEVGARRKLLDRRDVLEQAPPPLAPDGDEDDQADGEPHRPGVARAGMRDHREHPDRERQRRADERREREARALAPTTFGRARNGRSRSGSRMRSRMTASCAAVNAMRTPKE